MKKKYIILTIFIIWLSLLSLAWVRNMWIHGQRTDILFSESRSEYIGLWDYDKMMRNFWIWDIEKMKYETIK